MTDSTVKGVGEGERFDGSGLRVLIVHTRWNTQVIDPLVKGTLETLQAQGVKRDNIVVENVSGSFELPYTCAKILSNQQNRTQTFDVAIAIGVLIKGSTMHFEYIADAVSHGLMRVGLDSGVPLIFGVLTCLTDEQALLRAGVSVNGKEGHNHGIDWANAAVEQAVKTKVCSSFKALLF